MLSQEGGSGDVVCESSQPSHRKEQNKYDNSTKQNRYQSPYQKLTEKL